MTAVPHEFFDMDDSFRDRRRPRSASSRSLRPDGLLPTNSSLGRPPSSRLHQLEEADRRPASRRGAKDRDARVGADLGAVSEEVCPPCAIGSAACWTGVGGTAARRRHSVTVGAVAAAVARFRRSDLPPLDAHGDLREEYKRVGLFHASVARRASIWGPRRPGRHPEPDAGRVALAKEGKVTVFPLPGNWTDDQVLSRSMDVYLSFDLDALDRPSCRRLHAGSGGLAWYPTLALLRTVFGHRTVVAADIVELSPIEGWSTPTLPRLTWRTR